MEFLRTSGTEFGLMGGSLWCPFTVGVGEDDRITPPTWDFCGNILSAVFPLPVVMGASVPHVSGELAPFSCPAVAIACRRWVRL